MTRGIPLLWRGGENFKEIFDGVVSSTTILLAPIAATSFCAAQRNKRYSTSASLSINYKREKASKKN
ncbi:hypothetical protein DRF62_08575 [Chryseobacterium piscium]|uniref:Uncharacterized protein n=1 Tax=Chryseobacterium piscium TaxID=333702 RepID=A0A3D9BMK3_9FLAO|nr:hypothetical protein DRF62_08575 [Chryseobacterium piscium]